MADANFNTGAVAPVDQFGAPAPVSAEIVQLFDQVSYLAESYDSLQLLAMSHHGDSDPVALVLAGLNKRFETLLGQAGAKGLLS